MNGHRFRVPLGICYANDLHFLRRRLIPLFEYLQDVLHCWNTQRGVNRFLAERVILKEVKGAGILEGVSRLCHLRRLLLKHKRLAKCPNVVACKHWVQKARKVKYPTRHLDPTVKILAVVSGSLVPCKGNHFRRRYAYREGADYCASAGHFVSTAKQTFAHDAEQHALPNEFAPLGNDDASYCIRDALEVFKWEDGPQRRHVMPNVKLTGPLWRAGFGLGF